MHQRPLALALSLIAATVSATPLQPAQRYHCTPSYKLHCEGSQCMQEQAGSFEHAEAFIYVPHSQSMSACLWTDCYDGQAQVIERDGHITAMGTLSGRDEQPIAVVMNIDSDQRFSAFWQLSGRGGFIDGGHCEIKDKDSL